MAILLEGHHNPKRVAAEKRATAVKAVLAKYQGKKFIGLKRKEKDKLVLALAQIQGLLDEQGRCLGPEECKVPGIS